MSKISTYLASMGNSSQEVANHLELLGIKGQKSNPCFCPVIKAIYHKFPDLCKGLRVKIFASSAGYRNFGCWGLVWVEASEKVAVTWSDCQTLDPDCPPAVADFVRDFDAGKYPYLVGADDSVVAQQALAKLSIEERMALNL